MEKIKILIVDDHQLIVNGLKAMLEPIDGLEIIGEANDGKEAILKATELNPDVIIMDISMPILSGIEASKLILQKRPEIKILALTQHEEGEYVLQMINAGAYGYLLKNSRKEEFIEAIYSIYRGEKYFSKKISNILLNNLLQSKKINIEENKTEVSLTKREKEIIQKIAEEMSNQQIADELNISLRTVETHRRNVMQKLNVKNAVSLVKYAVQNHLISLN
jgi:two-component system response regulator DegU